VGRFVEPVICIPRALQRLPKAVLGNHNDTIGQFSLDKTTTLC
jgi:hypothetical protein